jgi:hypothetical protein
MGQGIIGVGRIRAALTQFPRTEVVAALDSWCAAAEAHQLDVAMENPIERARVATQLDRLEGSSVDDVDIKGKRVQVVDAAKIDTVVPWSRWSLIVGRYGSDRAERSDPARSTEAVLHVLVPELVHGEVFAALDLDLRRSEVTGGHDHAFADADGAVTSAPCRDLLARELEADRAAMATGVVGLRPRNHRLHPFIRRRAGPENSSRATSLGRSIPIGPQGASARCNATSGIGRPPSAKAVARRKSPVSAARNAKGAILAP